MNAPPLPSCPPRDFRTPKRSRSDPAPGATQAIQALRSRERSQAQADLAHAQHEALFLLALASACRDHDTGAHVVRMGFLAEHLALAAGMAADDAALLRQAAPLHDVGKIGIPDSVLKKRGALDAAERLVMNEHAAIGARVLGSSCNPLFQLAAETALTHHERWDGSGYPSGLAGKDIPLAGRIVSVVDCFDALTMDRCYRPAFSDDVALAMLHAERGRAFCPHLVDTFMADVPRMMAVRDHVKRIKLSFADLATGIHLP